MSALRFAFVGCGGIARHHLKALEGCSHPTQVVAVVDTKKENAQQFRELIDSANDCQVFSSLSDLLSWDRFDAAVVMVPHHLHMAYAQACLCGNKHVLLEKPMAHTLKSSLALLEEVKKSRTVFMVGEQSPHWPEVLKAKEVLESGLVGQPYHAFANYWEAVGFSTFFDEAHFFPGNWRFDPEKAGGGVLMDGATHWVRPLTMWFGDVEEVVGLVDYPLKSSRCETLGQSLLRFKSGHTASLYCHFNTIPMRPLPFFQIFGDKGEITIDGSFDGGMSYRNASHPDGVEFRSLGGFSAAFQPQMREFVAKVVSGGSPGDVESGERALREVMVAQAIYKSVKTKQWEKVTLSNLTS